MPGPFVDISSPEARKILGDSYAEIARREAMEAAIMCCAAIVVAKKRPQGDGCDYALGLIKHAFGISEAEVTGAVIDFVSAAQKAFSEGRL